MVKIKSIDDVEKDINCIGCALQRDKIKSVEGIIYEGKYFEIRQDYEIPIKGFFVISSNKHIVGFADFNNKERKEFIDLICNLRKGMKEVLKIK